MDKRQRLEVLDFSILEKEPFTKNQLLFIVGLLQRFDDKAKKRFSSREIVEHIKQHIEV